MERVASCSPPRVKCGCATESGGGRNTRGGERKEEQERGRERSRREGRGGERGTKRRRAESWIMSFAAGIQRIYFCKYQTPEQPAAERKETCLWEEVVGEIRDIERRGRSIIRSALQLLRWRQGPDVWFLRGLDTQLLRKIFFLVLRCVRLLAEVVKHFFGSGGVFAFGCQGVTISECQEAAMEGGFECHGHGRNHRPILFRISHFL
jgi:hypothetical protein